MHSTGDGIVVMGTGFGHITKQANRHELGAKLSKLASNCGANRIAYEISGSEFRVRFLRLLDDIFQKKCGTAAMPLARSTNRGLFPAFDDFRIAF